MRSKHGPAAEKTCAAPYGSDPESIYHTTWSACSPGTDYTWYAPGTHSSSAKPSSHVNSCCGGRKPSLRCTKLPTGTCHSYVRVDLGPSQPSSSIQYTDDRQISVSMDFEVHCTMEIWKLDALSRPHTRVKNTEAPGTSVVLEALNAGGFQWFIQALIAPRFHFLNSR